MVTCNESILALFMTKWNQTQGNQNKNHYFFHLSNFKMLQNSVGISDFYMLHVAARD